MTQLINCYQTEQLQTTLVPFAKFKVSHVQAKGIRLDKGVVFGALFFFLKPTTMAMYICCQKTESSSETANLISVEEW